MGDLDRRVQRLEKLVAFMLKQAPAVPINTGEQIETMLHTWELHMDRAALDESRHQFIENAEKANRK